MGRLKSLGRKSKAIAKTIKTAVQPHPDPSQKNYVKIMGLTEGGLCHFLDSGLCSLHRDFGGASLPRVCATYPRLVIQQGDHFELTGVLSCPEVARNCLLHEGAMVFSPIPLSTLPEQIQALNEHSAPAVIPLVQKLRSLFLQLVHQPNLPLDHAVYLIMYSARKFDALPKGTDKFAERFDSLVEKMLNQDFQSKILRSLDGQRNPRTARLLITEILDVRSRQANCFRFNDLTTRVLEGFGVDFQSMLTEEGSEILWSRYAKQKQEMNDRFSDRLNLYFHNYVHNLLLQERWNREPTVSALIRPVVFSYAVVKFLVFSHPGQRELIQADSYSPEIQAQLDRNAVESVQVFSRNISHNSVLLKSLSEAMEKGGLGDVLDMYLLLSI